MNEVELGLLKDLARRVHESACAPVQRVRAALYDYRLDAVWCSDAHRKRYKRREANRERQRQKYLSGHPDVSLDALYRIDPATWRRRHADDDDEHQDDAPGGSWSGIWQLHEAEQGILARYERLMAPYLAQQRRNPGVKPPGLVALERERDDEIDALDREYTRADEAGRAKHDEPRRIN